MQYNLVCFLYLNVYVGMGELSWELQQPVAPVHVRGNILWIAFQRFWMCSEESLIQNEGQ